MAPKWTSGTNSPTGDDPRSAECERPHLLEPQHLCMGVHTSHEFELLGTAGTLLANRSFFYGFTGLLIHAVNAMGGDLQGLSVQAIASAQRVSPHLDRTWLTWLAVTGCLVVQVNILEAKSQLSRLVKAALDGEGVIIASHCKAQVKFTPLCFLYWVEAPWDSGWRLA